MVERHMLLERELVKQRTLIDLPLAHHHLHSRCDNWSESVKQPQRNLRLFQQNRSGTAFQTTWPPCLLLRVKPPKPREKRTSTTLTAGIRPGADVAHNWLGWLGIANSGHPPNLISP